MAREHEVLTEALRHGRGQVNKPELEGLLALQESSGAILREGGEIATAESLRREREMVSWVNQGIGKCKPLGGNQQFVASDRLRPEQKRAVTFILGSRDEAVNMRGAAGTSKTATLKDLRRGLAEAGREVLALAPTMSAVEELQKIGFAEAITAERLLHDERLQATLRGRVVILDEAGMISAADVGTAAAHPKAVGAPGVQRRQEADPECRGRGCLARARKRITPEERGSGAGTAANQEGVSRGDPRNCEGIRSAASGSWMPSEPCVRLPG